MELSIAIVHHHRLLREALVLGLFQNAFPIVHQAHDVEQLTADTKDISPDVLLAEACRPLDKCLDCLRRFRCVAPECKVIMLEVPNQDETILACIEVGGISGYVVEEGSFNDLIRTVRAISAGESICSPRLANLAFRRISTLANRFYDSRTSEISWVRDGHSIRRDRSESLSGCTRHPREVSGPFIAHHIKIRNPCFAPIRSWT